MNTTEIYRSFLSRELSGKCQMNTGQIDAILGKFDKITGTGASGETAFTVVHEAYGATSTPKAILTIKGLIEKELGDFNKVHRGIDTNPVSRLREYIKRHNALVDKASVSIDGKDVTPEELAAGKIKIPSFAKDVRTYEATASSKVKGMTLEVIY
jgi:hypothetical protein